MAESPQFETLVQSLSSTLQSLEQKRKELKKQGHSTVSICMPLKSRS